MQTIILKIHLNKKNLYISHHYKIRFTQNDKKKVRMKRNARKMYNNNSNLNNEKMINSIQLEFQTYYLLN